MDPVLIVSSAIIDSSANELRCSGLFVSEPGDWIIECDAFDRTLRSLVTSNAFQTGGASQSVAEWSISTPLPPARSPIAVLNVSARRADAPDQLLAIAETQVVESPASRFAISKWGVDPETRRLDARGYLLNRGEDMVQIHINGVPQGQASWYARPDLAEQLPWMTDTTPGWRFTKELDLGDAENVAVGCLHISDRQVIAARHQVFSLAAAPSIDNRAGRSWLFAAVAPERNAPDLAALARRMTPKNRKRLIASRAFQASWAHPRGHKAFEYRRHIAEAMISRGEVVGDMQIRLRSGHVVTANPVEDAVIARKFLLEGTYERGLIEKLCELATDGGVFLDVGACYGHVSMALAQRVGPTGRVLSIEANPYMAVRVREAFARNGISNGTLVEAAASDCDGIAHFKSLHRKNVGGSRLAADGVSATNAELAKTMADLTVVSLDGETLGEAVQMTPLQEDEIATVEVRTQRLDDIVEEAKVIPELIKMDIEGAELLALRGASRLLSGAFGRRPTIALEYSNLFPTLGGSREDIFDLLIGHGYQAHRMARGKSGGGDLSVVATSDQAPDHDDLIFIDREVLS